MRLPFIILILFVLLYGGIGLLLIGRFVIEIAREIMRREETMWQPRPSSEDRADELDGRRSERSRFEKEQDLPPIALRLLKGSSGEEKRGRK